MFQPLKVLLKKRIEQYSFSDEILAKEVLNLWQKLMENEFGLEMARKTRAFHFEKGILEIKVSHPDLVQSLKQKEPLIIKKINRFCQRNFISFQKLKKITYKIGD